jgi:aldose sugar dehydrogenase
LKFLIIDLIIIISIAQRKVILCEVKLTGNMKYYLIKVAFLFSSFFLSTHSFAQHGGEVYKSYCAGCHGNQMEGASASALIKDDWQHGGDKNSILNTIKRGIPGTEMITWESILSEADIKE